MEYGQVHHIEYYVNNLESAQSFWGAFLSELNYKLVAEFGDGMSWGHPNGTYLVFVQVRSQYLG